MKSLSIVVGAAVAVSALGVVGERSARACGGCFHPPTQTASDITDERMLLSVSTTQTTLYDQIQYVGSPSSFAWVLPIHGTVTVGLGADFLFDSDDAVTATQITPPPSSCLACGGGGPGAFIAAPASGAGQNASAGSGTVVVTQQMNVGPYATVQLQSTDPTALNNWLTQNGYNIPDDVKPVIAQYVTEGFDFLAMKLLPNKGVQAMRPVRVTSAGASLSLPLRMAAVGTGAIVGITIWVVADGRYEPQNFPFFHIDDKDLVWDFSTSLSNYTTLRVQNEATLHNGGWEMESSLTLNQQVITNVILGGGRCYPGSGGFGAVPSDPSLDYLPVNASDAGADAGGGGGGTAEGGGTADVNTPFAGRAGPKVRGPRMRADSAHAAMTVDLALQASADQSEISNIRTLTQGVNEVCPCGHVDGGSPAQGGGGTGGSGSGSGASGGSSGSGVAGSSSGPAVAGSSSGPAVAGSSSGPAVAG